jgi:large subunit ribosomal protein L23
MARAKAKIEKKQATVKDYSVLLGPIITEKTSVIGEGGQNVVFRVDRRASKPEVKSAIESIFNVRVAAVRTCNYIGKKKRVTGSTGSRSGFRKAYVTLEPGHTIDVVEGI